MIRLLLLGIGNSGVRWHRIFRDTLHCRVDVVDPYDYGDGLSTYASLAEAPDVSVYDGFVVSTPVAHRDCLPQISHCRKPTLIDKPLSYPGVFPQLSYLLRQPGDVVVQMSHCDALWLERDVWVGLQMPFMPSYQMFEARVAEWTIVALMVLAHSHAAAWVGERGPHQQRLAAPYEFAHDLHLAYRLRAAQQGRVRIFRSLALDWPGEERRQVQVVAEEGQATYTIDREENTVAYQLLAEAFCACIVTGRRSPWSVSAEEWSGVVELIQEIGGV